MSDYQHDLDSIVAELNRKSPGGSVRRPGPSSSSSLSPSPSTPAALADLLRIALQESASDVLLVVGAPPTLRRQGKLTQTGSGPLSEEDLQSLVRPLMNPGEAATLDRERSVDLAFDGGGLGRFRANIHFQRGTPAASIRVLPHEVPTVEELHLPETVDKLTTLRQGLVLVTGPTGCGKSSTLAAIVDRINARRACHIVTIEEPIEYFHTNRSAVIEQIEVGRDTPTFLVSLRGILRQSPDVILVGEMRDPETISTVLTAAETGHLVLSTLHTNDTSQAVSRILDSFPSANQPQIRQQFSLAFAAVVAQQLVPSINLKTRYPALEILVATDAVRNLIRHGQDHQIRSQMVMSRAAGMVTMEQSLADLARAGKISRDTALSHCLRVDEMRTLLA